MRDESTSANDKDLPCVCVCVCVSPGNTCRVLRQVLCVMCCLKVGQAH